MNKEYYRRLQELFTAAVELPVDQRDGWIEEQCSGDERLLNELRNLLANDQSSQNPLEAGVEQLLKQHADGPATEDTLEHISVTDEFADARQEGGLPDSDLSSDEFCSQLSDIDVLSGDDLAKWIQSVQPPEIREDPRSLAQQLIAEGKLTQFQASVLLSGKSRQLLIDKYLILDLLDTGGMGMVFKAVHRRMKRVVALKMLPPHRLSSQSAVLRFRREVEVAATLHHPNIVTAHDADESKGIHFLVMEYVDGLDLYKKVTTDGPLSISQAVRCVTQAARGLQYAHEKGIIHRDIKPGNLILSGSETIKILDLGLASISERAEPNVTEEAARAGDQLSRSGTLLGTIAYMAPEQASDSASVDARCDIYALGCTFYFLLTGETPYGSNALTSLRRHRNAVIPSLRAKRPDVSASMEAVFQKMLDKKPSGRQQSMAELIDEFAACKLPGNESEPSAASGPDNEQPQWPHTQHSNSGERQAPPRRLLPNYRKHPWRVAMYLATCAIATLISIAVLIERMNSEHQHSHQDKLNGNEGSTAARNLVQQSLLRQLGEGIHVDSRVVELLAALRLRGDEELADELEIRIQRKARNLSSEPGLEAFVVVGRIRTPNGFSPMQVQIQSAVQPGGYFVAEVKDSMTPMTFRASGLAELEVLPSGAAAGSVFYVGEIEMRKVRADELASLELSILEPLPEDLDVRLTIVAARFGSGGREPRSPEAYGQLTFESLGKGVYRATGLSPTTYSVTAARPGFNPIYSNTVRLTAGESRKIGPVNLEKGTFLLNYAYARDGDFSAAEVMDRTASPKERIRFAPVQYHDVIYGHSDSHDCGIWAASNKGDADKVVFDAPYQPCYIVDLGSGEVQDFLEIDVSNIKLRQTGTGFNEFLQFGRVYCVNQNAFGQWVLLKVVSFNSSTTSEGGAPFQ